MDDHAGHDHGDHAAAFRRKFWLSLVPPFPSSSTATCARS
jgi:hypothetical protein